MIKQPWYVRLNRRWTRDASERARYHIVFAFLVVLPTSVVLESPDPQPFGRLLAMTVLIVAFGWITANVLQGAVSWAAKRWWEDS